jgi:DNA-binding Lrp family transcriptional regulator
MSSLRAAERYVRAGFAVVPIPHRSKRPVLEGWEALRLTRDELPEHFNGRPQNVGLILGQPSGGLVDVDQDAPEAAKIAGRFLPPTLTSGRESSPHSHWWYRAPGAHTTKFKDVDGTVLLELRSTGCQTIVAPSIHPDGERVVWHESGSEPVRVSADELAARVRELATAALIARYVPLVGGRHDYGMTLSGFLLRSGRLDEGTVLKVLKAAWHAAAADSREAVRDLEGMVRDTVENLAAGEPVVGGPTLEEYAPGIVRLLCKWWGWERKPQTEDKAEEKEERRNQADRLIAYALEDVQELFVDQHGAQHALIDGEPVPLTSRCYSWLRRRMWDEEGRSVSGEYLKMAAGTLSAHAEFSGAVRELYTRAAWHEGALYYELRPGKVVRVGPGGWTFEANPPVLFRRYVNLKALPDPEAGGSLDVLDELVNLKSERDRRLFKAYLITLPLEHVGRPIFNASGAMGSGKTTIQRLIKRLLDPTAPETVRFDPRDFLQKAMHAYIVMLDNQNTIPEWAADTLCRLVTGEADSKRRLYTDDEDFIIELRRAALLNGINVPTDRGDVLDRSLVVELERIPDGERKSEEQIWELFAREHPALLGSLFNVLSRAIALKGSIELSRRPRLADWGEYAAAVYEVMGWGADKFFRDWDEVVRVQNQATLDGSPVAQAIIKLMEEHEVCSHTSSKMHALLKEIAETQGVDVARDKAWPKSARWLWRRIKEVLPLLVAAGIEASRGRDESTKQITLRKIPTNDGSDGSRGKSRTDKGETHANTAQDDGRSNGSDSANGTSNGSEKRPSNAASANNADTANRYGDFSGEVSTPERAERIRRLVEEGMSETWARRTVLADGHPLDCGCEVCL